MTSIEHLNPPELHRNPAFSQAIAVSGPHRVVYIGGQNAVDSSGKIVGVGDIRAQSEQVARNLMAALWAGGAKPEHVVKWTVYVVQGQPGHAVFEVFQRSFGALANPPTISVVFVSSLVRPEFLLEVDTIAVVPMAP